MRFPTEITIARPPADVFDGLANVRNEIEWNSQVSRTAMLSEEPVQKGSRFTTVNRGKEYTATITTFDRPGLLVIDVAGKPMDITVTFRLAPAGEGTTLSGEFDMNPKGLMKALFPLMKPVIRKDLDKQQRNFKSFCEK